MIRRFVFVFSGILLFGFVSTSSVIYKLEAEKAGEGTIIKQTLSAYEPKKIPETVRFKIMKSEDASEGFYMGGSLGYESNRIPCVIPHSGAYKIWVRHYKTQNKPTSFYILFRDDTGEGVALRNVDFYPNLRSNLSATVRELPIADKDAKPLWVWSSFDVTFERPFEGTLSFGPSGGLVTGTLGIDCVIISDDPSFNPEKKDWKNLPSEAGPIQKIIPPKGYTYITPYTLHSSFFAGCPEREKQIKLTMVFGAPIYKDYAAILQLGFNRDRGWDACQNGAMRYGISTQVSPDFGYSAVELSRKIPSPEGRRINAAGNVSKSFSFSYKPFREEIIRDLKNKLKVFEDMDEVERFSVIGESGGAYDYSDAAKQRFHKFLQNRFGSIEKLNELWRTNYKTFDEIPLPKTPKEDENKAPWFAFREFSSLEYASLVGEKVKLIMENDPKKRPCTSQASCMHLNSPYFTSVAPFDIEEMINVGFEHSPMFGYDAYSTEDYFIGCDAELILSLVGNKEFINGEGNTHGQDPRIAARSYWSMIAKGLKGMDIWQYQDNPRDWVYSMWAMLKSDLTPRDKLAAVADCNHEIHRLENILKPGRRHHFVKPVALYYSRLDLSLPQPLFDIYGSAIDNPYRIYEKLRGLGYPVRWITPKQIIEGDLKNVGAVFLVGVKYVPAEAAKKLAEWVKEGGCIVGDGWPGAFDEYDRMQGTLAEVFGIKAVEDTTGMTPEQARIALGEAATPVYGVDPKVLKSLSAEEFYKGVDEMFDQWDSQHPVAKAVGNWHLSGYDGKNIKVISGEIIGQMMGKPGLVINDYGKGHALYSAIMLGTLYEAGPVHFEWDSSREGPALGNILDAFLRFSGLRPFCETDLPTNISRKLRIESPLIDEKGNVIVGMISTNDGPVLPFNLSLVWPDYAPKPKIALVVTGGSRKIEKVPFEIRNGMMKIKMPGFDTHAAILFIRENTPLVSLEISGAERKNAGIVELKPDTKIKIKATVFNVSERKLESGKLNLYGPHGWFCKSDSVNIGTIEPWSTKTAVFEVMTPSICARRTLRPITVKYESTKINSTPCTEIVWWTP